MKNKDNYCLSTFYDTFQCNLQKFIYSKVGSSELAKDLSQETFVKIIQYCNNGGACEYPKSFLYKTALNVIADYYRANKTLPLPVDANNIDAEENMNLEFIEWMLALINELPSPYKEAVRMADIDQIPQQEISKKMNISLSGAKSRIQRGREKLREKLLELCHIQKDQYGNIINCEPL